MSKNKKYNSPHLQLYKNKLPLEFINTPIVDGRLTKIHNLNDGISASLLFTILFSSAKEYIKSFVVSLPSPNVVELTFEEIYKDNYMIIVSKDPAQRNLLWYGGCFGTGNLSRSQPTWWERKVKRINEKNGVQFVEDLTAQRRLKKKITKEKQSEYDETLKKFVNNDGNVDKAELLKTYENLKALKNDTSMENIPKLNVVEASDVEEIQDEEDFVLTLEEYLYLKLFISKNANSLKFIEKGLSFKPDIPLNKLITVKNLKRTLVRFVVYSTLRNKGYIAREGLKFGCDFLVYERNGPVFEHAQYSIVIRDLTQKKEDIMSTEDTLSRLRIISSAKKKMIMMDVDSTYTDSAWEKIEERWEALSDHKALENLFLSTLTNFTVNQLLIERWNPERNRE